MKTPLSWLLVLGLAFLTLVNNQNVASSQQASEKQVPKEFSYPDSPITVLRKPITAKSLEGYIIDSAGFTIPKVLVERVSSDWERRLDAVFTDSDGAFSFSNLPEGVYYLRISMAGFDRLLIKVIVKKKAKAKLKLKLEVST